MADFYKNKHVSQTRKDHNCYDCGHVIPTGSEAAKSCTVLEGQFLHGYFCYSCVPDKHPSLLGEKGEGQG